MTLSRWLSPTPLSGRRMLHRAAAPLQGCRPGTAMHPRLACCWVLSVAQRLQQRGGERASRSSRPSVAEPCAPSPQCSTGAVREGRKTGRDPRFMSDMEHSRRSAGAGYGW